MGWWEARVVPHLTDLSLRSRDVMKLRAETCAGLEGRVLELGIGSGRNIGLYPPEVTAIDAVEPNDLGWSMSQERREASDIPVNRIGLDGAAIAAPDASYDAVLSTFTLCTIPDVEQALAEVRRVLRPGGTFAFLEHGSAPTAGLRRWQRRLEPFQRRIAGGCHLTRDIATLVGEQLDVVDVQTGELPVPGPGRVLGFTYRGTATRPG